MSMCLIKSRPFRSEGSQLVSLRQAMGAGGARCYQSANEKCLTHRQAILDILYHAQRCLGYGAPFYFVRITDIFRRVESVNANRLLRSFREVWLQRHPEKAAPLMRYKSGFDASLNCHKRYRTQWFREHLDISSLA